LFTDSACENYAIFKAIFKASVSMSHIVYNCPVSYARPNKIAPSAFAPARGIIRKILSRVRVRIAR